jgi:hypothetical protein
LEPKSSPIKKLPPHPGVRPPTSFRAVIFIIIYCKRDT